MCISLEGASCWCQEDTQSKQGTTSQPAYYFLQVVQFLGLFFVFFFLIYSQWTIILLLQKQPAPGKQTSLPWDAQRCWNWSDSPHTRFPEPPWALQFCGNGEVTTGKQWGGNFCINPCPCHPPPGGLVGIITPQQRLRSCFSLPACITLIAKPPLICRLNIFTVVHGSVLVG